MKSSRLVLFFTFLFFLNPLVAILVFAIYGISVGNNQVTTRSKIVVMLFGVMCCSYVSLINMVKEPESDLWNYVNNYSIAKNFDLLTYLYVGTYDKGGSIKEPMYSVLVWILNRLYGGNIKMFLFTISMLEYCPMVAAMIYYGRKLKMRLYVIMAGIMLLCFIPYIFVHSMHLVRQTLANAILCYVMVQHFFGGKKEWVWMVIMVLIHSTSALFLPLLLIPGFGKPFKKAWIWYVGAFGFLICLQFLSLFLLKNGIFEEGTSASYALGRASGSLSYDRYNLGISNILLIVIILIVSILIFIGRFLPPTEPLKRLMFLFIFTCLFILVNIQQDLLAARYSHYFFSFVPFIVMIPFQKWNIKNNVLFLFCSAVIVFFTIYLYSGAWNYNIPIGPWFTPVFGYMI